MARLNNRGKPLHQAELRSKVELMANRDGQGCSTLAAIRAIMGAEKKRMSFQQIRRTTSKWRPRASPRVDIPSGGMTVEEMWESLKVERDDPEQIVWTEVCDRDKVESLLLRWCKLHFRQTRGTPLSSTE